MKKVSLFSAVIMLVAVNFLAGCVASSYGLSDNDQEKAIEKYHTGGLNLHPADGFWMISGKVLSRTLLCPITLAISEGVLCNKREEFFRNYAIDLEKEKYVAKLKEHYDSFLGKDKNYIMVALGKPAEELQYGDVTTLYYEGRNLARIKLNLILVNIDGAEKLSSYRNNLQNNFSVSDSVYSSNEYVSISLLHGKCVTWEVAKVNPNIKISPRGEIISNSKPY